MLVTKLALQWYLPACVILNTKLRGAYMKVLVVGSGGREHAIVKKLKESKLVTELYCAPGNGGIAADATCVAIKAENVAGMVRFAVEQKMDFVVVTPDDPLALGMVDALNAKGVPTFGPNRAAAIIESSKVFSKNLMKKYGIPTAFYEVFHDAVLAKKYITEKNTYPIVIKADGLALGKGVIIAQNEKEAFDAIDIIMKDKMFGESGNQIVIEEFLNGVEVSVLAFTDGNVLYPMVSSMDHKRVYDNDKGPNTGGMGTIAPNPYYTKEIANVCMEKIFLPTIKAMKQEGRPFSGCLYFGLMLTEKGPYVIEYNCRFGDPETQVVLPLLKTDLMQIMLAIWQQKLSDIAIEWKTEAAACIIMASGGYPKAYKKGIEIHGLDKNGQIANGTIFHAGTKVVNGKYFTDGGRVLGVMATGKDLSTALTNAYQNVSLIQFEGAHYRKDIGKK